MVKVRTIVVYLKGSKIITFVKLEFQKKKMRKNVKFCYLFPIDTEIKLILDPY